MNQKGADRELARLAAMTERAQKTLEGACAAGDPQLIADAVERFRRIEQTARGPQHPTALINLVNALIVQAEVLASDDALGTALDLLSRNEQLFRNHPMRPAYLARQGKALLIKAQRTGDPSVMREAVTVQKTRKALAPKEYPEHGACMFDVGLVLTSGGVRGFVIVVIPNLTTPPPVTT